ncbi:MAG: uroporphyrinogen decarboxylase family protein [Planctomycetota bacterium]
MMTDLENFRATVEHRQPGRVLYHAGFTPDLKRRVIEHIGTEDIAGHYGMVSLDGVSLKRPADAPVLDFSSYWDSEDLPEGTEIDGRGVAKVPSGYYHFWGYVSPLRRATDIREIEQYPLQDVRDWPVGDLPSQVAGRHAEGKIAGAWIGHMYEDAWQIRGYEQFLLDMMTRPEWAHRLLDRLAEQNRARAVAYARAGCDLLRCGDDVANQQSLMFSPDMWREFMLSRWGAIWAEIKQINPHCRIWYHSDGNILPIAGELLDAGVDILNPLQPEALDVDELHRRFGPRVTFDGLIGTQSTMPWGSPEDVRARVREVIDRFGRGGGLMISPTHVLEPEVPLENIDAMLQTCREYGTFET